MTRTRSRWRRRPPDRGKLIFLAGLLVAALVAKFYLPWVRPIFHQLVDGDRSRGNRVGFLLGLSCASLSAVFGLLAQERWSRSETRDRILGGLAAGATIITLSPLLWAWYGRGPPTRSERAFDRAIPGVQDGVTVGVIAALVVGTALVLVVASLRDRRRRSTGGDQQ